jgi:glutamate--cysteine ligase
MSLRPSAAALATLTPERLAGMRRGIEKESLRCGPSGALALTPHPPALGAPLTHPHITTDFCESQLELVTGAHKSVEETVAELGRLHQFVYRTLARLGDERLWVGSMPCGLPSDETIPLARYGASHVSRAKSVYRMGLGLRYGRRMQTISGIHYNWSLPGLDNEAYFGLIRNFRRHSFVLLTLFGASPAVCPSFVAGREHGLERFSEHALYLPHATSLRMGRLGYQSDAQAQIAVSYNGLEPYAASLHEAMTRPYPPYAALGIRSLGGEYHQLATSLLQIENEFYGTIRPKRVIHSGERPLHALRERGVEYVEVRCMDLDPFEPVGISEETSRFIDIFLLHCLGTESPPDTPDEIAALKRNQHLTAAQGRAPGLMLELPRGGGQRSLHDWAAELLAGCEPIAERLDAAFGHTLYSQALERARTALQRPGDLPSARVLQRMGGDFGGSYTAFVRHQSERLRERFLSLPWSVQQQAEQEAAAAESHVERGRIEAADAGEDFEAWRLRYLDPAKLWPRARRVA